MILSEKINSWTLSLIKTEFHISVSVVNAEKERSCQSDKFSSLTAKVLTKLRKLVFSREPDYHWDFLRWKSSWAFELFLAGGQDSINFVRTFTVWFLPLRRRWTISFPFCLRDLIVFFFSLLILPYLTHFLIYNIFSHFLFSSHKSFSFLPAWCVNFAPFFVAPIVVYSRYFVK